MEEQIEGIGARGGDLSAIKGTILEIESDRQGRCGRILADAGRKVLGGNQC